MSPRGKRNVAKQAFMPLAKSHPELAAQWHPTKNGNVTPNDVKANNTWPIWWVCPKGHEWQARPWHRTNQGNACPFCAGRKVAPDETLTARFPAIAAEWHPTKNGKTTPDMGANFTDYLREAWRVLKLDGKLHIFEATSRFTDREAFVAGLKKLGFANIGVSDAWKFTHISALRSEREPAAEVELRF